MLYIILLGIIGGQELTFIILAILLLFGGKKIPELMRGLGQGLREFKEGQTSEQQEKQTK
ncbi:twin-arginine translocase TatA/TatE family subunit [Olivibacter sp. SDN3]|uniref:Sec-independent protein translocase subunit TatA/TatB n=1 Tax=Olivibacter sp. SDN3 TaxID=2764720 RepID=UPI001651876B|nr:twin-arginine translocase TatA/TatE family subunit [Olivibacter sp. SDN3]QNL52096.1 twin-arginine translocase TatA/TatE family subunit [Olivibacter sp. SDN3]